MFLWKQLHSLHYCFQGRRIGKNLENSKYRFSVSSYRMIFMGKKVCNCCYFFWHFDLEFNILIQKLLFPRFFLKNHEFQNYLNQFSPEMIHFLLLCCVNKFLLLWILNIFFLFIWFHIFCFFFFFFYLWSMSLEQLLN